MNFGTKGCMYNCGDECTGECIKVETKTKMSKEYAMKNQVSIMLQRDGFEKSLKIVNETILEKQYSSTQTYWKVFKEELINQNKDE